jgi:hypothetical protein
MIATLGVLFAVTAMQANKTIRAALENFKHDALRKRTRKSVMAAYLPAPVQRYLQQVLPDMHVAPPVFAVVRMKGKLFAGSVDTPMKFKALDYFVLDRPHLVRVATWWFLPFAWLKIVEVYEHAKGSIHSRLWSAMTVKYASDHETDTSLLLRYLTHALCFPFVFTNTDVITWEELDDRSARAILTDGDVSVSATFYFSDEGLIEKIISFDKFRGDKREEWEVRCSEYQRRRNVLMPTVYEFGWNTERGTVSYAKYRIGDIWYDVQPVGETETAA